MTRIKLMLAAGAVALAACGTDGNTTPDGEMDDAQNKAGACLLTKDLEAYKTLTSDIPTRASEGRLDVIALKADALSMLAEKARDTSNYANVSQQLSCRFIEVQTRATLAEIAFTADAQPGLAAQAMEAVEAASGLCPVDTPDGRRECALINDYYAPMLFARSAIKQLDSLSTTGEPVDWETAESLTAELISDVDEDWPKAMEAAKASKEGGAAVGVTPYDILRREYEALACSGQRATIELSKQALKPENMTSEGQLRDYDLRGQALRAEMTVALDLASNDADRDCYSKTDERACRLKLGNQVLSAFCAAMLNAQD